MKTTERLRLVKADRAEKMIALIRKRRKDDIADHHCFRKAKQKEMFIKLLDQLSYVDEMIVAEYIEDKEYQNLPFGVKPRSEGDKIYNRLKGWYYFVLNAA